MSKSFSVFMVTLLCAGATWAAPTSEPPEYEVMCRVKAKDIAAETYRGCVTDARTTQIDQLKKDYQDRLKMMKDEYQQELRRLGSGKAALSAPVAASASKSKKISKRGSKLPAKSVVSTPAAPQLNPVTTANSGYSPENSLDEMTVKIRPPGPQMGADESTLDVPEPTPIEEVPTADSRF